MTLVKTLGHFISQLAPANPSKVTFSYTGKVARFDCAPLTVCGLAAFLNYQTEQDINMVNARMAARERGIAVEEIRTTETVLFSNLITITLESPQGVRTIAGTTFEGRPRIVKMRDFTTDFIPEPHMLVMHYEDRPGLIGKMGTILGEANINIGNMNLGRQEKAGEAMVVLSIDTPADEKTLAVLKEAISARYLKAVDFPEEILRG